MTPHQRVFETESLCSLSLPIPPVTAWICSFAVRTLHKQKVAHGNQNATSVIRYT